MDRFTNRDIQNIFKLSRTQIIHWTKECGIIPEFQDARGTGSSRIYSKKNLFNFALIKVLMDSGISLTEIRDYYAAFNYAYVDIWREGGKSITVKLSTTAIEFFDEKGKQICLSSKTTYKKIHNQLKKMKGTKKSLVIPDESFSFRNREVRIHFSPETKNNLLGVVPSFETVKIFMCTNISFTDSLAWGDSLILVNLHKIKEETLQKIK